MSLVVKCLSVCTRLNKTMSEKEFLEQFINIYQLHPCIWDTKCKDYSNKHMRNDAYGELVEYSKTKYPNATKDFVIKKIHALRCSFRRELKKVLDSQRKTGSSADDVYVPTLWYYDLMSFIGECETPRQGKCTLDEQMDVQVSFKYFIQCKEYISKLIKQNDFKHLLFEKPSYLEK